MTMRRIISGSRLTLLSIGRIYFNCNRVFSGFGFIFLNLRRVRGGFMYCYSRPVSIIF